MYQKLPYFQNWARNVQCGPSEILRPESTSEIINIIQRAAAEGKKLRIAGNGHSFTPLNSTDKIMINLENFQGLNSVDINLNTASAKAGTSIKNLNHLLYEKGFHLINLGDIDVQSIAGATATGTHGTGLSFGNISAQMAGFTIATANGELIKCSKNQNTEIFNAGRVSMGALGIMTEIEMEVVPAYKLDYQAKKAKMEETLERLEEYNAANRNFEFYWFPFTKTVQLKITNISNEPVKDNETMRYINQQLLENNFLELLCGIGTNFYNSYAALSKIIAFGATSERKINYSHLIYATPRNVRFKEMEYNIPLEYFKEAFRKVVKKIHDEHYRVYFPIECRFVKGDDIWLSPSYGRDSAYIAIHVDARTEHDPYFKDIEKILMEYGGRPHWGKMHNRTAENLSTVYPMWDSFMDVRKKLDPEAMFLNDYLKEMFQL